MRIEFTSNESDAIEKDLIPAAQKLSTEFDNSSTEISFSPMFINCTKGSDHTVVIDINEKVFVAFIAVVAKLCVMIMPAVSMIKGIIGFIMSMKSECNRINSEFDKVLEENSEYGVFNDHDRNISSIIVREKNNSTWKDVKYFNEHGNDDSKISCKTILTIANNHWGPEIVVVATLKEAQTLLGLNEHYRHVSSDVK